MRLLKAGYNGPVLYEERKSTKPYKNISMAIYVLTDGGSISAAALAANLFS